MDRDERRDDRALTIDRETRINVVVNRDDGDEDIIDTGRVLQNFRRAKRVYVWVLLLCMAAGASAALLFCQLTRQPTSATSVVTLDYEVTDPETGERSPVSGLVSPDGRDLDVNQITSSHVLESALSGMKLSRPVTASQLGSGIRIQKIQDEDSLRQGGAVSLPGVNGMDLRVDRPDDNPKYDNLFLVSLTNGFGGGDTLTDAELQLVLDRVLSAYNDCLAGTYADRQLPVDEISAIDIDKQDLPQSLDMLYAAMDHLREYCDGKPDGVRAYRSWRTGLCLNDLMEELDLVRSVGLDALRSHISLNGIAKDREAAIADYRFRLASAQSELDAVQQSIEGNRQFIETYRNDEILVSMPEFDATASARFATDSYNALMLQQADDLEKAAGLEERIGGLRATLEWLSDGDAGIQPSPAAIEQASAELENAYRVCHEAYEQIRAHMEEIIDRPFYNALAKHSTPEISGGGSFASEAKKTVVGALLGMIVALGLWFLSALAPELRRNRSLQADEKEARKP